MQLPKAMIGQTCGLERTLTAETFAKNSLKPDVTILYYEKRALYIRSLGRWGSEPWHGAAQCHASLAPADSTVVQNLMRSSW